MENVAQYAVLAGKRVVLQYTEAGSDEVKEAQGTLETANELGLLFKPRGRQSTLIFAEAVVGLEEDTSVDTRLKPRRINPVPEHQVRQHLADRHGYGLSAVNSMTDAEAVEEHDSIHADDSNKEISHYHREKRTVKKDEAADAA